MRLSWEDGGVPSPSLTSSRDHSHAAQEARLPATDAGVGAVAHAAPGEAVVLEEAAGEGRRVRVESPEHARPPPPCKSSAQALLSCACRKA